MTYFQEIFKREANIIEKLNELNRKVIEKVKNATGIHPRTRVVGLSRDTFSVDISTGEIRAVPGLDPEVTKGYLVHENGHRSVFPVSSSSSMAFIAAVKSLVPNASNEEVFAASNIVADTFSDLTLFMLGLGNYLSKRIPDFLSKATASDLGMMFKIVVYKTMEYAVKGKRRNIQEQDIEMAIKWLINEKHVDPSIAGKLKDTVYWLVNGVKNIITNVGVENMAKYLLNPFTDIIIPGLDFLPKLVAYLITENKNMNLPPMTSMMPNTSKTITGGNTNKKPEYTGKDNKDDRTPQKPPLDGLDIVPNEIRPEDIQASIVAMPSFGVKDYEKAEKYIEEVFSDKIKEAIEKLIKKIQTVYSQNAFRRYRTCGYKRKTSLLWLKPMGEPDEDSILLEPRKLMWRVSYHVPSPRGRLSVTLASVPEKLIIVQDESASTFASFESSRVLTVESFISMLVAAGLRYMRGAKTISVIKFSSFVAHVYDGRDIIEAGVRIMLPSKVVGLATNIKDAVDYALRQTTKNTALVVVTDAFISNEEAKYIGKKLRKELDKGKLGFVVFVVVNPSDTSSIEIIKSYLAKKNSIVEHIRSAEDMVHVSNGIINHILKTYTRSS